MEKVIVEITKDVKKEYPIFIGVGLLEKVSSLLEIKKYSKILLITDKKIKQFLLDKVEKKLQKKIDYFILSSSEQEKNIENVQRIWNFLIEKHFDRKSLIINFGGGVVTDLGGFVASTYMRGIDFINIPTTLLSQVDASVGGKTGINFAGIKNLVGTFTQPKAVIIDINTLETLPRREFLSGFAEIIKHGLIKDKKYFEFVTSKHPLDFSKEELVEVILASIKIKRDIIKDDERESDGRKILNFGHTIGHAIESLSLKTDKPLLHGEAISIGMFMESKISNLIGSLSLEELEKIKISLINSELPIAFDNLDVGGIINKMEADKKNEQEKINLTLISSIGNAIINQNPPIDIIKQVLQ